MKQGDVEKLGVHILMCGDATKSEDVANLIMHATYPCETPNKIRLILTDPPYGVSYVENKDWVGLRSGKGMKHKKIENDNLTGENYSEFTKQWLKPITPHLDAKNAFYIFNSDLMICDLKKGLISAGFKYSQMVIWIKNSIVLGRKDYNPQHELIIYGWYGTHRFERGKGKSLIYYPKPAKSKLHPTMKPVGLLRKLILNSTKIGETVYDPFGGSGSTLIACENTRRRCLMIEKDPDYCETIIKRWKKLKGGEGK